MPCKDKTGPKGEGPMTGKRLGNCGNNAAESLGNGKGGGCCGKGNKNENRNRHGKCCSKKNSAE
ncbi:MAG: DUF5320 domain-containing protein [Candidatus Gastranaerophilales bacterium]|nr:DUF5320 domain-containing protein [Candidatus Gastranaerophilales bacterium]